MAATGRNECIILAMNPRLAVIFLLLLSVCVAVVSAQKTSDKQPSQTPKSTRDNRYPQTGPIEVKMNLLAVDNGGKDSLDISSESIRVFEDGVEQKITAFQRKPETSAIGILVDNSGSLRTLFSKLLYAGQAFATNISADSGFVIRFVSSDKIEVLQSFTSDRSRMIRAIDNMYIEGGRSAVIDGLYLASEHAIENQKKTSKTHYSVILISDGEDSSSFYNLDEYFKLNANHDIQVFPVFFPSLTNTYQRPDGKVFDRSNNERLANILALRTGGTATMLRSGKLDEASILAAIQPIIYETRAQYTFSYTPTNQNRDGLARKVVVQLNDAKENDTRMLKHRETYIVPLEGEPKKK